VAHGALGQREQVRPVESDASSGDAAGRGHEPHDAEGGHALAASRLPDEPQHLAAIDRERHALERARRHAVARELHGEAFDGEERHQLAVAAARSSGSTRGAAGGAKALASMAALRSTSSKAMLAVAPPSPFRSSARAKPSS